MEYINRIELQGEIGAIRVQEVNGLYVANFSLATVSGKVLCETTWHNIVAWEESMLFDPYLLKKGDKVRIVGRLRTTKYTSADGYDKVHYEVIASMVSRITE